VPRSTASLFTSQILKDWPGWSAAKRDLNSFARRMINPFSLLLDDLELMLPELERSLTLATADPDAFPYKAWVSDEDDISNHPNQYGSSDQYLNAVDSVNGNISGVAIGITEVTPDNFRIANPTGFFVSGSLPIDSLGLSGVPQMGEYDTTAGEYLITTVSGELSGETVEPSYAHGITIPEQFSNIAEAELGLRTFVDPMYTDITVDFEAAISGSRMVLDYHLGSMPTITRTIDNVTSDGEDLTTWTNTQDWKTVYETRDDLDNDGIIDAREEQLIIPHLGIKRSDDPVAWDELYAQYDLNGDEVIDELDLLRVQTLANTIRPDGGDILEFGAAGAYSITFQIPRDGYAGTTSFYRNAVGPDVRIDLSMESFRNETFGHLLTNFDEGYIDSAYDPSLGVFYYLDEINRCIWAVKYDAIGINRDKFKIILPYEHKNTQFRGITYIDNLIYVLVIINGKTWIYLIETSISNPEASLVKLPVHAGNIMNGDPDIRIRDGEGLSSGVTSLGSIDSDRLMTIDGDNLKFLYPLVDVYSRDVNERTTKSNLVFREKYDSLTPYPEATMLQTYFHLWNVFDEYALERGLERHPGENNSSLKETCLDVYDNPWTMDPQGIHYGIARSLRSSPYIITDPLTYRLSSAPASERISGTLLRHNDVPVWWDTITEDKVYRDSAYLYSKFMFYSGETEMFRIENDTLKVNEDALIWI